MDVAGLRATWEFWLELARLCFREMLCKACVYRQGIHTISVHLVDAWGRIFLRQRTH